MGERKIPNSTAGAMVVVAFLCDLINIAVDFFTLGIGGFVLDFVTTIIFGFWFSLHGVSLASSRNIGRTLLAILFDAFPVTDFTFPWTMQVAYTAFTERKPAPRIEQPESRQWRI